MATNIQHNGVDLDSIFAPLVSGWPTAGATNLDVNGVDLNLRYAGLASGVAAALTNLEMNGTDLASLFATIGSTTVQVSTINAISGSAAAGYPNGTVSSNFSSITATKGKQSGYTYTWVLASGSATIVGQGTASAQVTGTINAGSTVSGTIYCQVSDGTTTVNTNTVAWSLTNTTPARVVQVITFTGNSTGPFNLAASHNAGGANWTVSGSYIAGHTDVVVNVEYTQGGTLAGITTPAASFDTGTGWTAGDVIYLIGGGNIFGAGGRGYYGVSGNEGGTNGGDAINLNWPITIGGPYGAYTGNIGGGGGGGGGSIGYTNGKTGIGGSGGGGGAGFPLGPGGAGGQITTSLGTFNGAAGTAATSVSKGGDGGSSGVGYGGVGGAPGAAGGNGVAGGTVGGGGGGGGLGAAGGKGGTGTFGAGTAGLAGGYAIRKNGYAVSGASSGPVYGTIG